MSFGESRFLAELNQKIAKEDLFIKGNHGIQSRNRHGKALEDSRRLYTEVGNEALPGGASRPHLYAAWPLGSHLLASLLCRFSTAS
jgi:hypothetical protein